MYYVEKASPDKLYRAALLRNRLADTILEALEKAFEKLQGDKRDPKKVRMEREEFERQQREEKALLQAEAKVAEDSRRKAEAEVAAAARDNNDDGTDGGELRMATNVSLFSEPFPFRFQFCVKQKRNKYSGDLLTHYLQRRKRASEKPRPFPTHYLRRRKNLDLFRRTTYTTSGKPRSFLTHTYDVEKT
ncbi:transcription factor GTE10-like [Cucumis melo var. makuwa]|uniref:Transcription factor GTE10-like n=1 Tax=Cucumis melo var. makuwa TaxID=1194695 RepID=A0A5A7UN63_CUCMM|nr:transcription factor GTE10-like [Cucumis melo var. makuwa]TYK12097.1 transcription factor GTE10-like [Cucumis melo var. makuwa]